MELINHHTGLYTNYSYAEERVTAFSVGAAKTGAFIRTIDNSAILCRVHDGSIYFYDRQAKAEIQISMDVLNRLAR